MWFSHGSIQLKLPCMPSSSHLLQHLFPALGTYLFMSSRIAAVGSFSQHLPFSRCLFSWHPPPKFPFFVISNVNCFSPLSDTFTICSLAACSLSCTTIKMMMPPSCWLMLQASIAHIVFSNTCLCPLCLLSGYTSCIGRAPINPQTWSTFIFFLCHDMYNKFDKSRLLVLPACWHILSHCPYAPGPSVASCCIFVLILVLLSYSCAYSTCHIRVLLHNWDSCMRNNTKLPSCHF